MIWPFNIRQRRRARQRELFDRRYERACTIIAQTHRPHRWTEKIRRPEMGWDWIERVPHHCPGVVFSFEDIIKRELQMSMRRHLNKQLFCGEGLGSSEGLVRNPFTGMPVLEFDTNFSDGLVHLDREEPDPEDAFCGRSEIHGSHWPKVDGQVFYCDGNDPEENEPENW